MNIYIVYRLHTVPTEVFVRTSPPRDGLRGIQTIGTFSFFGKHFKIRPTFLVYFKMGLKFYIFISNKDNWPFLTVSCFSLLFFKNVKNARKALCSKRVRRNKRGLVLPIFLPSFFLPLHLLSSVYSDHWRLQGDRECLSYY